MTAGETRPVRGRRRPLAWRRLWIGPLIVLAVMGLIFVVLSIPVPRTRNRDLHKNTRLVLELHVSTAEIFHQLRGRLPESMADLESLSREVFDRQLDCKDGWGTRIRFRRINPLASEFEVRSAGPNRIMDDSDDLFQRFVVPPPERK